CVFNNTTDRDVTFGTGTGDEMCYNFMYVTPPPDIRFCDGESNLSDFDYTPGQCLSEPVTTALPPILGEVDVTELPTLEDGPLGAEGAWILDSFELLITPENNIVLSLVDIDSSTLLGKGQLRRSGDQLQIDVAAYVSLRLNGEGLNFEQSLPFSFTIDGIGDDTSTLDITQLSCGNARDLSNVDFGLTPTGDLEALLVIDF
ncbi:MAG: hypothetical protein AAFX99_37210, partial [Myxococcota bacterium]